MEVLEVENSPPLSITTAENQVNVTEVEEPPRTSEDATAKDAMILIVLSLLCEKMDQLDGSFSNERGDTAIHQERVTASRGLQNPSTLRSTTGFITISTKERGSTITGKYKKTSRQVRSSDGRTH